MSVSCGGRSTLGGPMSRTAFIGTGSASAAGLSRNCVIEDVVVERGKGGLDNMSKSSGSSVQS